MCVSAYIVCIHPFIDLRAFNLPVHDVCDDACTLYLHPPICNAHNAERRTKVLR